MIYALYLKISLEKQEKYQTSFLEYFHVWRKYFKRTNIALEIT